jgi:uncharacterized membrane protein YraQ (UPF0718 family)
MDVLRSIGDFISSEIFGMSWLDDLFGRLLALLFGETFAASSWGGILRFFLFDFVKIGILLCLLIFIVSYIQSYFPPERTKRLLARHRGIGANAFGALLGTVTPFCSCSSIPIFIGFTRAGLSSGVTFSFLISSPLVDLGAFVLLSSVFGFRVAFLYVVVGLILAVVGGTLIERTGLGNLIEPFVLQGTDVNVDLPSLTWKQRAQYAKDQVASTYRKVVPYIAIGVAVGAMIHDVIPAAWIEAALGSDRWYAVPLATIVGAPIYADIFGTIPVAEALYAKGAGLGTILAFMMAVTTLSIPSFVMLKKVVKWKLLLSFLAIVMTGIVIIGYLFNALGFLFV